MSDVHADADRYNSMEPLDQNIDLREPNKVLVYARRPFREVGQVIGSKRCTLEGCLGTRLGVRWPKGNLTWPCTKGMKPERNGWRIL